MANNHLDTYTPDSISIPASTIRDLMDELGLTQKELAGKMKISIKALNEIIKGKNPVTPEIAAILEKILKTPASFWISREKQYREFLSHQDKSAKLKREGSIFVRNVLKKSA